MKLVLLFLHIFVEIYWTSQYIERKLRIDLVVYEQQVSTGSENLSLGLQQVLTTLKLLMVVVTLTIPLIPQTVSFSFEKVSLQFVFRN